MKVYIVMTPGSSEEGGFIEKVFKNEEDASKYVEYKNKFKAEWQSAGDYEIVEENVIESELKFEVDKDKTYIRIKSSAKMDKYSMDTYPYISIVVEDEHSETKYSISNYFKLFEFTVYVKAKDEDYELSEKDLEKKYKYVVDDIRNIVEESRHEDCAFDIITSKIKETLTYLVEIIKE